MPRYWRFPLFICIPESQTTKGWTCCNTTMSSPLAEQLDILGFLTSAVVIYDRLRCVCRGSGVHAFATGWFTGKCVNSFFHCRHLLLITIPIYYVAISAPKSRPDKHSHSERRLQSFTMGWIKVKVELRVEQIFQICESKDKLGVAVLLVPRESHSYITIVLSRPV